MLTMINRQTKFEMSSFTRSKDMTRDQILKCVKCRVAVLQISLAVLFTKVH